MAKTINKINKVVFKGKSGRNIVADITYPVNQEHVPVVIYCHGFKGFKDWGHFNLMAEEFAKEGFAFLKFNFSHNGGTVENPIDFPDLKAFGENDFLKELEDMSVVLGSLFDSAQVLEGKTSFDKLLPKLDANKISMMGHSRGGGMSTIFCASEKRIKQLVLLAAVSDFAARQPADEVMKHWNDTGVIYIENGRTKQQMPMYYNFVEVFENNLELLNIKSSCENLTQETLIIQGLNDEVVPPAEAENLVSWISNSSSILIENSDHAFGSCHPYLGQELPGQTKQVVIGAINFLKKGSSD
jgi:cephalosporin-C deacetylase-like acetyl esterase